MYSLLNSN